MDYESFKESFLEDLKKGLEDQGFEGVTVATQQVNKLNESYEAVTITPAGSSIGVNTSLENFFNAYNSGVEYSDVVERAINTAANGFDQMPQIDIASLTDYEQMKEKLIMEVVGTDANTELLSNVPHKEMEDLSVVYRFMMNEDNEGRATILVTNNMVDVMGITPEQLHEDAVVNAPIIKPAVISGMTEVMMEMMGPEQAEMMGIMPMDPSDEQMFVATVPDKIHGAGVLAYENFMDQASERVGGSFFILPSSLHELLLIPDNGQMELHELESMVREVNETQVSPEERLSDNVYHYDAQEKVFELGEKFVERQNEKESGLEDRTDAKESVLGDLKAKKEETAMQPKKDAAQKAVSKSKGGEAI